MSQEPNIATTPTQGGDGENGSSPPVTKVPETIPYDRFQELNVTNKELSKKLKALETEKIAAAELAAREKGEFEKLYNDNLPKIKEYDELKGVLENILKSTIESIPEAKRKLIPSEYSPQKQLDWINANRDVLVQVSDKNAPVSPSNPSDGKIYHKASDLKNLDYYQKHRADILQAQKEGRIID